MPRLIWAPSALLDVQRAFHFLAEKNMDAAKRAIQAIRSGVQIIANHPETGHPADEMEPEYREWMIDFGGSEYVVLYHYDGQTAVIVAVRHQKEAGY
jgi:addiction module RelE/StbE family toxin